MLQPPRRTRDDKASAFGVARLGGRAEEAIRDVIEQGKIKWTLAKWMAHKNKQQADEVKKSHKGKIEKHTRVFFRGTSTIGIDTKLGWYRLPHPYLYIA